MKIKIMAFGKEIKMGNIILYSTVLYPNPGNIKYNMKKAPDKQSSESLIRMFS